MQLVCRESVLSRYFYSPISQIFSTLNTIKGLGIVVAVTLSGAPKQ